MADAAAALPADPAVALKRAQQGKGYWQRVWQRLREVLLSELRAAGAWALTHGP